MIKVLFICHGNICRSTMAEYIFKDMIKKRGLEDQYECDSAATSREEIGNPIYTPAAKKLAEKGVPYGDHRARQVTRDDYDRNDILFVMDDNNRRNLMRIIGEDPECKIRLLLPGRSIADPWYTGDFESTYQDLILGLEAFWEETKEEVIYMSEKDRKLTQEELEKVTGGDLRYDWRDYGEGNNTDVDRANIQKEIDETIAQIDANALNK